MKKLKLLSLALVAVMALIATPSYAANGPYDIGEIKGTPRRQGEPVRTYKLIRFSTRGPNIASLASNDVVVYDTNSDDSVSVRTTTTSADAAIAGVVQMTIQSADSNATSAFDDAGKRNWGYILVHGPAKVSIGTGSSFTVGQAWMTSADAGKAGNWAAPTAYDTKMSNSPVGGFFYDTATASDTTAEVFVRLE